MEGNKVSATIVAEKVKARIAQLEQERDMLIQQANQQISSYNGAILELKALLEPEETAGEGEERAYVEQRAEEEAVAVAPE